MTQSRPIWVRRKLLRWYWYDCDTWTTVYSDMTETPSFPLTLISLTHLGPTLHRYDCDTQSPMSTFMTATLFTFDTLMTETPLLDLAHIWLRRQKYFLWFISWHKYDCDGQNFCFLIAPLTQLWLRHPQIILKRFQLDTYMTATVKTFVFWFNIWHNYDCDTFRLF